MPEHMRDNFQSLFTHSAKVFDNLESKIKILSSFLGTLRGDYFRQTKTAAKKERRN
jgi:hypothetical protein